MPDFSSLVFAAACGLWAILALAFATWLVSTRKSDVSIVDSAWSILILAAEARDDALAEWRHEATARTALVLGVTALIALIGFYLVRQLTERQRMAAAVTAKEADFRLLAEESSDMVMRIGFDERILYVSPSCDRILGWRADQLAGTPALAGVNPDDLPRVRQIVEALKQAGGNPRYTEYPEVGHDSWKPAYKDPELFAWIFAQKKATD